jgi:hypothetical protein
VKTKAKAPTMFLASSNQSGKLAGEKKEKVRISFGVTCNFFRGVTVANVTLSPLEPNHCLVKNSQRIGTSPTV